MFKDELTGVKIHADLDNTVIRATHRPQDLIPALLEVLKDTPEYPEISRLVPAYALEDDESDWWESDTCIYLLNETIQDTLDFYAPEGYYFGCHPGDGSDFGFWQVEEDD